MLVVAAAFVFGAAVVLGFSSLEDRPAQVLVAVAVAAVGVGVAFLPDTDLVVGTGLVALGAGLFGSIASTDALRYGLPALVLLALAATGPRVWLSGAGALVALALPDSLVLAVVLTLVVLVAPERAWWGDLAAAAAAVAALTEVSVAVAAVLLMIAVVRRDLVTGLLAAAALVVPAPAHVWPLAVIIVVALVAIRVPRVRAVVTRLPALRHTRPAHAAAGAAAVAASGLVAIALQLQVGWLTLVAVLVAGALGHWLPAPAGPALAVVALVGLGVEQPYFLFALVAVPLLIRHPVAPVFAATAFLVLRVSPLDPFATILIIGAVAAVLAFGRKTAPAGQAMGAVVLGAVVLGDARPAALVLVLALAVSTGWRPSAPLAVTAAFAGYVTMTLVAGTVTADGAVTAALLVAAAALVVAAVFAARRHASGAGLVHRA